MFPDMFTPQQLVFISPNPKSAATVTTKGAGTVTNGSWDPTTPSAFHVMYTLQLANLKLAELSERDSEDMTLTEVMSLIRFDGIVAAREPGIGRNSQIVWDQLAVNKLGLVRALNLWGNNLVQGTPLWLIPTMDRTLTKWCIDPTGNTSINLRTGPKGSLLKPKAWQFIPWADAELRLPSKEILMYTNNDDPLVPRYTQPIYVGRVMFDGPDSSQGLVNSSAWDRGSQQQLGFIDIWTPMSRDTRFNGC
jgi:hypothetical protein